MDLYYEFTLDDLKAYTRQGTASYASGQRALVQTLVQILLAIAIVVGFWLSGYAVVSLVVAVVAIVIMPFAVLGIHQRAMELAGEQMFADMAAGGPTTVATRLTLQQDGIIFESYRGTGLIRWPAITKADQIGDYLVLGSGFESRIAIPKRAFRDEQHMQAFLDEVNRHRTAGAAAPAAPPVQ